MDGLLAASEEQFAKTGKPLYSSHMLDLSEEPLDENIETCKKYLTRMAKLGITLEIELGVTGGEEDGVDNTGVDESRSTRNPRRSPKRIQRSIRSVLISRSRRPLGMFMESTSPATSDSSPPS